MCVNARALLWLCKGSCRVGCILLAASSSGNSCARTLEDCGQPLFTAILHPLANTQASDTQMRYCVVVVAAGASASVLLNFHKPYSLPTVVCQRRIVPSSEPEA
eukprot:m.55818 g.55818  ORF g.55818 m.55818 type:complete len:104 (+) comp48911_c0_seq1:193-504(+)